MNLQTGSTVDLSLLLKTDTIAGMSGAHMNHSNEAEEHLIALVDDLHAANPEHPIFGPVSPGMVRAPWRASRENGVSWINIMRRIARSKYRQPITWGANNCWMATASITNIKLVRPSTADPSKMELCRSFKTVRVLAFFANPTTENWAALSSNNPTRTPFDHICQRGERSRDQEGYVCINGIEHGVISSRDVNESRKYCKYGSRAFCPGHGPASTKCVFTHPDGTIMPCRNVDDMIDCNCLRRCY